MTEQIVKYNELTENGKSYVVDSVENSIPKKMSFLNLVEYDGTKYWGIHGTGVYTQLFEHLDNACKSTIPNATYYGLSFGVGDVPCWEWDFNDGSIVSDKMGSVNFLFEIVMNGNNYDIPNIVFSMHECDYDLYDGMYGKFEITESNIEDCVRDLVHTSNVQCEPEYIEDYVNNFTESVLHAYKLFKSELSNVDKEFRRNLPYALDEFFTRENVDVIIDYDDYSGTFKVIDWNI